MPESQAFAALAEARENGLLEFDTAPHYGAGLSEERIGRWLAAEERRRPGSTAGIRVSTKVGRFTVEDDAGADFRS